MHYSDNESTADNKKPNRCHLYTEQLEALSSIICVLTWGCCSPAGSRSDSSHSFYCRNKMSFHLVYICTKSKDGSKCIFVTIKSETKQFVVSVVFLNSSFCEKHELNPQRSFEGFYVLKWRSVSWFQFGSSFSWICSVWSDLSKFCSFLSAEIHRTKESFWQQLHTFIGSGSSDWTWCWFKSLQFVLIRDLQLEADAPLCHSSAGWKTISVCLIQFPVLESFSGS